MKMSEIYLLVGGEATRLQPLSSGIPKALLSIRGVRIIDKIIKQFLNLENFNFNLICSIKHEKLWIDYKNNHNNNINLLFEKSKLDTAGYIIENLDSMPDKFYCMNGDLLLNVDLPNFINASSQCSNSLIGSFEVEDPTRFGVLEIDQDSKITQFIEKPKDKSYGNKISLGLYHLYKRDLLSIQKNLKTPCSFERQVFPSLSKAGLLSTYTVNGDMLDVGTLESYISAHIAEGEENWVSPNNVQISESALIKNSVILDNCIIEDNVTISDSIISSNSIITKGTIINKEIIRKV
jgi:NDP-sugar pyrophosphorylase family protein